MAGMQDRMQHSDAFAWYMEDDPALRSTVVAVVRLDREPDWVRLRERIDRLTGLVPQLRMRVQSRRMRLCPPRWVASEAFDLHKHLTRRTVPAPGGWDAVLELAREAAESEFDRTGPLWQFTLLHGMADGSACLLMKLHHSLTDGVGGMQLAAHVFDLGPDGPAGSEAMPSRAPRRPDPGTTATDRLPVRQRVRAGVR